MCRALVGPLQVLSCPSASSQMVDAITLNIPDVYPSVEFKTISRTITEGDVFKVDLSTDYCAYSPALRGAVCKDRCTR